MRGCEPVQKDKSFFFFPTAWNHDWRSRCSSPWTPISSAILGSWKWLLKRVEDEEENEALYILPSREWPCLRAVISHQQCFKQLKVGFQSAPNRKRQEKKKGEQESTHYFSRHIFSSLTVQTIIFSLLTLDWIIFSWREGARAKKIKIK